MSTQIRRITFFCILAIKVPGYALYPTTELSTPQSLSSRFARRRIPLTTQKVELNGTSYTVDPLEDQGYYSDSFKIIDGFEVNNKRVPAILKRVSEKKTKFPNFGAREEIGYLKRDSVNLHLFSQPSNENPGKVDIVVRDIGEEDPPFKPFYKWYLEDETIAAYDGLYDARKNVEDRLIWYAKEENLLYRDCHAGNIFIRKEAMLDSNWPRRQIDNSVIVMPIDWGPPSTFTGIQDIQNEANKEKLIEEFEKFVQKILRSKHFNVEALYNALRRHGHTLRKDDWEDIKFIEDDKYYDILHVENFQDAKTYKIVDGFKGESALLDIIDIDTEEEALERIEEYKKNLPVLATQFSLKYGKADIFYKDERKKPGPQG